MHASGTEVTWSWDDGVRQIAENGEVANLGAGGVFGLLTISVVSGLVSGIAEALGRQLFSLLYCVVILTLFCRARLP
jgi:hypothetical protein